MEGSLVPGHRFSHAYTGDHFAVVSLKERLRVPYGSFSNVDMTREWNPEERDVLTYKYYLSGTRQRVPLKVKLAAVHWGGFVTTPIPSGASE